MNSKNEVRVCLVATTKLAFPVALAALALFTACGEAAPPGAPIADCPAPLMGSQGMSFNGMNINGMNINGMNFNGMNINGMNINGMNINGMNINGMNINGMNINGMNYNGMQGQGIQVQGIQVQGIQVQGIQVQGIQVQGLQALGLQGQGPSPQGLQGIALRGVTSDEASLWLAGDSTLVATENVVMLRIDDGVLKARSTDGALLADPELVGLLFPFSMTDGSVLWIRLSGLSTHPDAPDLGLYELELEGENLCGEGGAGLFVPGIWDESGARHDSVTSGDRTADTTYACTTGVITKCVAWGYRPWTEGARIHEACTRMARADYCGDGVPHTEEGTLIDMFDTRGIQAPVDDDGLSFEAGWGPNGAVCVREPRYVHTTPSGEVAYPSCWHDLPVCESWPVAVEQGAVLGNDSAHTVRELSCGQ